VLQICIDLPRLALHATIRLDSTSQTTLTLIPRSLQVYLTVFFIPLYRPSLALDNLSDITSL
jgi:hypothetical protein